jgi:predicted acetyltransferase
MSDGYPIRAVDESELHAFTGVLNQAFNSTWPPAAMLELDRKVVEPERTLAAFDGDRIVGTALAFSFGLTVPGGSELGTAGVSFVAVLPTHRRRGILTQLMRRQLTDIAAGDEPLAALFASEAVIYGRFGYGQATDQYGFTFRQGDGQLISPSGSEALELRLAEPTAVVKEMQAVYESIRPSRPGMVTRRDNFWQVQMADLEFMRDGSSPLRCVLAEDRSGVRGYALYSGKPDWGSDGMPAQELFVRELLWTDPAACAALWSDLLSRDLVTEVRTRMRPTDDPILHMLADPRRARVSVSDGLWIRLVDLPRALGQRRYLSGVDIVLEVSDSLLPANSGRWHLVAGGPGKGGAPVCERTTSAADIVLPVSALGAAYLGQVKFGSLAQAGRITELRPGAIAELSAAMRWDPAPWSPMMF